MPQRWNAHDWQARERLLPPVPGERSSSYGSYGRPPAGRWRNPDRPTRHGRVLRLAVLAALWLGVLIWPAPQLGSFVTSHFSNTALRFISSSFGSLPGGVETFASTSGSHQYWQVGLAADGENSHATGMRATIQTRVPERVSANTTDYFWVGSYLSDGSFIQLGYYVPWYDDAHAGWFYCAFSASGHAGPCEYGRPGSAGADASRHTYTLETAPAASGQQTIWLAELDGTQVGKFTWTAADTGASAPVMYAESSGFSKHDSSSQLGPVDFSGGLETRPAGTMSYARAAHAVVMYSAPNVCPPYGIRDDGDGGALIGSGLACPDRWSQLW